MIDAKTIVSSDLVSRSRAKTEILNWARLITNPKLVATEDMLYALDVMDGATVNELKAEAKRRGYNLVKIPER